MTRTLTAIILAIASFASMASALTYQTSTASIRQDPNSGHLWTFGELAEYIQIQQAGNYTITVNALGMPAAGVYPQMALSVDGFPGNEVTVGTSTWQNYTYTASFNAGTYTIGVAFMNDGMTQTEDRNLGLQYVTITPAQGQSQPVLSTQTAWFSSAQARENAVAAATDAAIQQYRTSNATVTVLDANGNPLNGATVTVQQTRHDFLFGASFAGFETFYDSAKNATYEQRFRELFNYATIPFYWSMIEPVQGQVDYPRLDSMVNWCANNNITAKGHALLWSADGMLPSWIGGLPSLTLQQTHVTDLMSRYASKIDAWEVVNEPVNEPELSLDPPQYWANALDPTASLIVNEYGHFYSNLRDAYSLLAAANQNGVPYDVAGIQAHAPAEMAFPMFRVQQVLDMYAQLGKSIHITEFTPAANGAAVTGSPWRGTWTEAQQADYAEMFYRVCFAHPAVDAISWWDFCDYGAWVPGGGMLRSDLSPKPVYDALKQLIHEEWNTSEQGSTSGSGSYGFNGFYGAYTVSVTYNGQTKEVAFHLAEGANNALTVQLAGSPSVTVNHVVTNDTTPNLSGSVANANAVKVTVNGSTYYNATISGSTWSVTIPVALSTGTYNVQATATNAQGSSVTDSTTGELVLDATKPVITLLGANPMTIKRYSSFTDPGATAADNMEGDITSRIVASGTVNTRVVGAYKRTYTVTDWAGNTISKTRTVYVKR